MDDALALLMAFDAPHHEVVALTIAAGNVGLKHTVANALKLCEVAEVDIPVYAGCDAPLLHAAPDASYVHGRDGFGDIAYPPAAKQAEAEHAAQAMIRLSHAHAGRLVVCMLGPLTNLAVALKLDPTLPRARRPDGGDGRRGDRAGQHHADGRVQHRFRSGGRASWCSMPSLRPAKSLRSPTGRR